MNILTLPQWNISINLTVIQTIYKWTKKMFDI